MHHKIKNYQNFLKIIDIIKSDINFPALSPNEEYLFNEILKEWSEDKKISVKSALKLNNSCSASTNFKHLKQLRKSHLLEIETDELDNRIKYIVPSVLAVQYATSIGNTLKEHQAEMQ